MHQPHSVTPLGQPGRRAARFVLAAALGILLAGCHGDREPAPIDDAATPAMGKPGATAAPAAGPSPEQMAQWSRNCALCHIRGEGGAPVLGDEAAWAERLAQGEEVLLKHTLEGLNNMPPLGYCMDCEEADFRTLIRFMAGGT